MFVFIQMKSDERWRITLSAVVGDALAEAVTRTLKVTAREISDKSFPLRERKFLCVVNRGDDIPLHTARLLHGFSEISQTEHPDTE